MWDVGNGSTCHLSRASSHFCKDESISIYLQPLPDGVPEAIPFFNCAAKTKYNVIRALCTASHRPTVETREHVVWTADSDTSDTTTSSYLFIFETSASELFVFLVDGEVLSCISDYNRPRRHGVFCFISDAPGGSVALHHYAYSNRWSKSDTSAGFVSDQEPLTSHSFVLVHCESRLPTPFLIVGTTKGVQYAEITDGLLHLLPNLDLGLQAVKLLKPNECGALLYILTSDGVQVYNVHTLQAEPLQLLKWSVAELSLDGKHIAFAGTHQDQSCWIQVWNTANQEVVLHVTMDECSITSIAVSEMYVCYHLTNIINEEWKLACRELKRKNEELVLSESNQKIIKDRSLTLDGSILVERVWGPYAMNLYRIPERTTLYEYQSQYPTLIYLLGTLGAENNHCGVNPPIRPSPTVKTPFTSITTVSESVSSTVKPTKDSTPGKSVVSQWLWIAIVVVGGITVIRIIF